MARPRKIDSDLRHGRHCVFVLHVHLVFVTKYRRNVFKGEHDHVHLLINYPPKVALSSLVASLKGVSARLLRKEFGDFHPWLKRRGVLWSPSYFASSCGGAPIDILRQYIEEQQTPH